MGSGDRLPLRQRVRPAEITADPLPAPIATVPDVAVKSVGDFADLFAVAYRTVVVFDAFCSGVSAPTVTPHVGALSLRFP